MKGEKLYESMNHVDDQILERSERRKQSRRRPWWMGAVAAVLVAAVAVAPLNTARIVTNHLSDPAFRDYTAVIEV